LGEQLLGPDMPVASDNRYGRLGGLISLLFETKDFEFICRAAWGGPLLDHVT